MDYLEILEKQIESACITDQSGKIISFEACREISDNLKIPLKMVEITALKNGILPKRYHRNLGTVGMEGQLKLLESSVAVVGAGGIGGYVLEGLARLGVGRLITIDRDSFEETNLNRQLLGIESNLGKSKVEAARDRIINVNSAVEVIVHGYEAHEENLDYIIEGCQVVVDALDTVSARLALQQAADKAGIPMVHGAIAGFWAQISTILPGDVGLKKIYASIGSRNRGIETLTGNPCPTPMLCASYQCLEVMKLLLGKGEILRNKLLLIDTEYNSFDIIPIV